MFSENLLDHVLGDVAPVLTPLKITLFSIGGSQINLFDIIEFLLIFLFAYSLGKLTESSITKLANRHSGIKVGSISMFAKIIHWAIILVGVLLALSAIGLPINHLAILVSALSVGIGFGLQTIVNNSIAGLILLSEKAVNIGNIIETPHGKIGRVNMITIRATRIVTATGEDVIVPNSNLIDKDFVNYSIDPRGVRRRFSFAVPYGIDLRKVKKIIEEAAVKVPFCIKPDELHEVECGVTGFGNFGINMELVVWVDPVELMEPYRLESAFLTAINDACVQSGIIMPGPNYAVSMQNQGTILNINGSTPHVPSPLIDQGIPTDTELVTGVALTAAAQVDDKNSAKNVDHRNED